MTRYTDYLNKEIERVTSTTQHAESYKRYLKYAKKIKRNQMLFIDVELLSNKD
jgi:hypothetical protein